MFTKTSIQVNKLVLDIVLIRGDCFKTGNSFFAIYKILNEFYYLFRKYNTK